MKKTIFIFILLAATGIAVLVSCSKSSDTATAGSGGTVAVTGDSVLINIGNNLVIPAFQNFSSAMITLDAAITAFNAAPNATTLLSAQAAYKAADLAWQNCSPYQFGPALDQTLVTNSVNAFPTDSVLIKNNISTGTYTIDGIANIKAQGFPGIDFLLFGADNATTLARFTTDAKAANAKTYLSAIASSIKTKAAAMVTAWSATGGNYIAKFTASTGVSSGSSLSILLNAFIQDYETARNYKIGIPIGKYGIMVLPQSPTKTEGYYSNTSVQLMIQEVKAIQNVYLGGTGLGFDDKAIAAKATKNGIDLNTLINAQFAAIFAKLAVLQEPLSASIVNNNAVVLDAYTEMSKLIVLLKVDLSSALGVKISFQDDDGD